MEVLDRIKTLHEPVFNTHSSFQSDCVKSWEICQAEIQKLWLTDNRGFVSLEALNKKTGAQIIDTSLTTCLSITREHVTKSGEIRQRTLEITADTWENYPTFKQTPAQKEHHHLKNQLPFGKCSSRAAGFQNLTIRALIVKIHESGNKKSSQKPVFHP